jgi:hypothetical protein
MRLTSSARTVWFSFSMPRGEAASDFIARALRDDFHLEEAPETAIGTLTIVLGFTGGRANPIFAPDGLQLRNGSQNPKACVACYDLGFEFINVSWPLHDADFTK